MWLSSVFLKTLRDGRIAILGWGIGMGLIVVSPMASVATLLTEPSQRAELAALAKTFAWNADPVAVDTPAGYAVWKIGIFIFLIAVWPLLAAGRTLRGEEERGAMDVLLSLPRGRVRVAVEKVAAMWATLLLMCGLVGVVAALASIRFDAGITMLDGLAFGLDLALVCAVFGGVTLLASQFTQERGPAAAIGAGVLLVSIALDMVRRIAPDLEWISRLSPVYYYNQSKALIPGYGSSGGALLVLFVLALGSTVTAIAIFARRDVGAPARLPWSGAPRPTPRRETTLPLGDWSLRSVYARGLGMVATSTFWWSVCIAGAAGWMVIVVKQIEAQITELIASSPQYASLIGRIGGGSAGASATLLSAIFSLLPLLLMAFAITQVNSWASDEEDGRLDLVLATPRARARVLVGRFAALATATAVIGVLALAATALGAQIAGMKLDAGNLVSATLGMIPLGLLIAAIGYLAAGWLRTAADTGLLSFVLGAWFFISFIGPELEWPDVWLRLSAFYYYGTPLQNGLPIANVVGLLAVGAIAVVLAAVRFTRKDVAV